MKVVVIDGQGGKLGKSLVEEIKKNCKNAELYAIGTNSVATVAMQKGGADYVATGENPVLVQSRDADIIVGPMGIVMADSLLGEITPRMAQAVGESKAAKILVPFGKCKTFVAGIENQSYAELVLSAVNKVKNLVE